MGLHNQNERKNSLDKELNLFRGKIGKYINQKVDVFWQPKVMKISLMDILIRFWSQFLVETRQRKHLRAKRWTFLRLLINMIRFIEKLINLKNYKKTIYREICLTRKHIMALEIFVNSDSDYLIVLEDDVIFKNNIKSLEDLQMILESDIKIPMYVDLAGGIRLEELLYTKTIKSMIDNNQNFICMDHLLTNTTCSYLVNKQMAEILISEIFQKNGLVNRLPIDWLFNSVFNRLVGRKEQYLCIHFTSNFFIHGSKYGYHTSSIR